MTTCGKSQLPTSTMINEILGTIDRGQEFLRTEPNRSQRTKIGCAEGRDVFAKYSSHFLSKPFHSRRKKPEKLQI